MKDNREAIRIALEKCRVVQKEIAEDLKRQRELDRMFAEEEEREFTKYGCVVYEWNAELMKKYVPVAGTASGGQGPLPEKKEEEG